MYLGLNHFFPRPRERIVDDYRNTGALRVDGGGEFVERAFEDGIAGAPDIFQVALGIEIIHGNARPGKNVVEIVKQEPLPCSAEIVRGIALAE